MEDLGVNSLSVTGTHLQHMRAPPRDPSTHQVAVKDVKFNKLSGKWEYDEGQEGDFDRRYELSMHAITNRASERC